MSWVMVGVTAASAVGSAVQGNQARKAAAGAAPKPIDIAKIIADARENAAANYANSFALERQYNPQSAELRTAANNGLSNLATGNTAGFQARDSLLSQLGSSQIMSTGTNPLLEASAASILDNLKLGGALGRDVQQQTVKAALEKGGMAGISGSGAARGLVARDIGLTSLGLLQQRQGQALQAGSTLEGIKMQSDQLRLQDFLGRIGAAQGAASQDTQRAGLLAQIMDARALPESGLSPGALANLYVGDKNVQDQSRMDQAALKTTTNANTMNALLGFGSAAAGAYAGQKKTSFAPVEDNGLSYV